MDKAIENRIKVLKNSYEMYEDTKKETVSRMKDALNPDATKKFTNEQIEDRVKLIEEAQKTIEDEYLQLGGDIQELKKKARKRSTKKTEIDLMSEFNGTSTNIVESSKSVDKVMDIDVIPERSSGFDERESYDIIPLPSKGECYKEKLAKIPVSYLNAYDENIIASPNLYRDNLLIDTILKEKVLSDVIDTSDMLEGDRDAIILWLRAGGYGVDYPITANDDKTGESFEANIDLSKIGYKPFNLKGDSNGWFEYVLPVSKKEVKFRFLTHRDNLRLKEIEEKENAILKKERIESVVERLDEFIDDDNDLEKTEKVKVREAIRTIEKWGENIENENSQKYTHAITNRLQMSIMSIDGITDRKMIRDFIKKMPVKDSSSLRKYITDNEPGVDYNITIEKPASLGGGSMNVFLQLDQFIFLNLP